ncbi:MAG: hypothetical protein ACYCOU_12770 [Sulfobacillus sp.]
MNNQGVVWILIVFLVIIIIGTIYADWARRSHLYQGELSRFATYLGIPGAYPGYGNSDPSFSDWRRGHRENRKDHHDHHDHHDRHDWRERRMRDRGAPFFEHFEGEEDED